MSIRTRLLLLILFATLIPALVAGGQFLERRDAEIAAAPPAGKLLIAGDLPSLVKFALEHGLTLPT